MKIINIFSLTVSLMSLTYAISQPGPGSSHVIIGNTETISSKVFNGPRRYWISIPTDTAIYGAKKFPVIYVLDGTGHFFSTSGMVHQLSTINGNDIVPKSIVVSIGNGDRTQDLTPTHVNEVGGDSIFPRTSGGLSKFTDFLQQELIPHIEKNYPALAYRTFVGHSLGGLAVIHTLFTRSDMFQNYIALDPSVWWDKELELNLAKEVLNKPLSLNGKNLYVAIANTHDSLTIYEALKDTSDLSEVFNMAYRFGKFLDDNHKPSGLNFSWKYYADENHSSIPLIGTYHAFQFLFPWHRMSNKVMSFFNPAADQDPQKLKIFLKEESERVSKYMGIRMPPDEANVNQLGYVFMQNNKMILAQTCFETNVANYPGSANAHDSLGDYWMSNGDEEKAKQSFEKALTIKDIPGTRRKLNQINAK